MKRTLVNNVVYWGERKCEAELCDNGAYYFLNGKYKCGVHTRRFSQQRTPLPKDPNATQKKQILLRNRELLVLERAQENKKCLKRGNLICSKFRMMKDPEHFDGYRKVFPNFKHQSRTDGFGCKSLSPKDLGPVIHNQPGVPVALNIENYHQYNKVFRCEVDKENNPLLDFYTRRDAAYKSNVPKRHKFSLEEMNQMANTEGHGNKNIPLYSIHVDKDGKERRYTYVESRFFYCRQYEMLAPKTKDFEKLVKMLDDGINLQIVGYDAYPITKTLQEHYEDPSKPFGHELVLYTLLVEKDPVRYPWNVYARKHPELYGL